MCSENNGADLRHCFQVCKKQVFSWSGSSLVPRLETSQRLIVSTAMAVPLLSGACHNFSLDIHNI